jgi:hypothetical protein
MNIGMKAFRRLAAFILFACAGFACAQQLDAKFSCSAKGNDGEPLLYADSGEMHLNGDRIDGFRWESSVFRSTHGFDCSIDDSDNLHAEVMEANKWRISPVDARKARDARGYDAAWRLNCTIRVEHDGDMLHITPSCPALCGSRKNFSELSVNLKTGECRYED